MNTKTTAKSKNKNTAKAKQPLNKYPRGWNRKKMEELAEYYDNQSEDEAVAEAEAAFEDTDQAMFLVPHALIPKVHKLLAQHAARKRAVS